MEQQEQKQKHSGIAIASFVTSIVSGVCMFLTIAIAGVIEVSTPGGMDENSVAAIVVGLLFFLFISASLIALGLGIAALFQRNRKKIFPILGVSFAAVTVLVSVFVLMVGLATS